MALGAIVVKVVLHMVGINGSGKLATMAIKTISGSSGKLLLSGAGMAHFAVCSGMGAYERKSPLNVCQENFASILPVSRRMAGLALSAQLTLVMITVTITAFGGNVRKCRRFMTTDACCRGMSTTERKAGFRMIEFR